MKCVFLTITLSFLFLSAPGVPAAAQDSKACRQHGFENSSFLVCEFDSEKDELRLARTDRDGRVLGGLAALGKSLGADSGRVLFAMNAGMFDPQGTPVGLYVENGVVKHDLNTRSGSGNFYLKPNGVFWMDSAQGLHVDTTDNYGAKNPHSIWATQSGPMLVIAGKLNSQIDPDGSSRYVRNGVGIRDAHHAVFVISDAPESFGKLARFFRDELNCQDALYFDGAISSIWVPALYRQDNAAALGPMAVVLLRK
jgi:uncharacterized protein YigE (DUF2233 family)